MRVADKNTDEKEVGAAKEDTPRLDELLDRTIGELKLLVDEEPVEELRVELPQHGLTN